MADEKLTAATRIEKLLDNIAGGENEVTPATRLEKFLSYIADAMEGGGSGGGSEGKQLIITITQNGDTPVFTPNITYAEMSNITGGLAKLSTGTDTYRVSKLAHWIRNTESYELYFISKGARSEPIFTRFNYNADGSISAPAE